MSEEMLYTDRIELIRDLSETQELFIDCEAEVELLTNKEGKTRIFDWFNIELIVGRRYGDHAAISLTFEELEGLILDLIEFKHKAKTIHDKYNEKVEEENAKV